MAREEYTNILINKNRAIKKSETQQKKYNIDYYESRKHLLNSFTECSICGKQYSYYSKSRHLRFHKNQTIQQNTITHTHLINLE
jgi:hypothetical protein